MLIKQTVIASLVFYCAVPAVAQDANRGQGGSPIYSVTVVDRTTKAINYQYRQGPTKIDFRGTVLLPHGDGEATVESKRGRTEIDAKFEHLTTPTAYGREYLTYTLWAITPQGAARNLGEIVPGGSDKAHLHVTTELQAFGLIVTAEPYSAARRPSDVVVMENEIRSDTVGTIQPINAKYELMPRGHYTWHVPTQMDANIASMPKVSMSKYEAMLAVYEAQNAIGIARAADADRLAAATFQKAEAQLEEAQRLQAGKNPSNTVVQNARQAAQTAEDSRVIAEKRHQEEQIASAKAQVAQAQEATVAAQAQTQQALAEAQAARAQTDAERAARERAEAEARAAQSNAGNAARVMPQSAVPPPPPPPDTQKTELRRRLTAELNNLLPTRDTPRGLVVTIEGPEFQGSQLNRLASGEVARVATIIAQNPGLQVSVEEYSADSSNTSARAEGVRNSLVDQGISPAFITVRGMGDARPLASNLSQAGREQNRRVEIVVSGDAIGSHAAWDHPYSVIPAGPRE